MKYFKNKTGDVFAYTQAQLETVANIDNPEYTFPIPQSFYDMRDRLAEMTELTGAELDAHLTPPAPPADDIKAAKVEALWAAADRYVTSYISGVAIGILTIGVIQGKPKAMEVTGWSNAVWTEYHTRKAAVTVDGEDNLDFSSFGPMPHSVPELQAEIDL